MKKLIIIKALFIATVAAFSASCSDDDERVTIEKEETEDKNEAMKKKTLQIDYTFSASKDFKTFYHFIVTYSDIAGQQHADTITDDTWRYVADPVALDKAPENFLCKICAVRKDEYPELTAYAYTLSYEQNVKVAVNNPDGSEAQAFEGGPMKSWSWQASPTAMKDFLESSHNVILVDFALEKSAFSAPNE